MRGGFCPIKADVIKVCKKTLDVDNEEFRHYLELAKIAVELWVGVPIRIKTVREHFLFQEIPTFTKYFPIREVIEKLNDFEVEEPSGLLYSLPGGWVERDIVYTIGLKEGNWPAVYQELVRKLVAYKIEGTEEGIEELWAAAKWVRGKEEAVRRNALS